ncbi:acetyl-CoA carboxylase like biotin dependent carboxylase involved in fatty acid biosynthesis [Cryptosporidium ryanae]|uniref:acetyl-CoA carboxylase like biotin dependent carboxylase involved in fatty acid biosynthesis n=1 Tax=Cryptosporidium ryanae TaxID=515981 RepID=UPI00351A14A3|nr:acetyl-CoA carboxylase like biotin dependent carboxylase involved in fatty acid biosynthesis [Cryptosporidium ryanae]
MDLDLPIYSSVEEFIEKNGGINLIKKILVATSGQAAIKCIRSMRHWAYVTFGNEKAFEFVVMATPEDIRSNSECVSEADYYVDIPMGPNYHNYANIEVIVSIAEEQECDAVWPGWGHASENPDLPLALSKARRKIIWIGPSAESMETVGQKIQSNIIAQSVDVPCVPWSGDGIFVNIEKDGRFREIVTDEQLLESCVSNIKDCERVCERIGFPVMIKASAGGGGKGIRLCNSMDELESKYRQVVNEVKGGPVFLMRAVAKCKHLEVQIIGDNYGDVFALSTRDCTIQRRHQKVIEEGPVTTVDKEIVEKIEKAAERMCRAVGYSSAGTVEFLYDIERNCIAFLEVNARLQVEHIVSEGVTNCNIPAAQLQIAMGIPLKKIRDIQEYRKLCEQGSVPPRHIIAARITSEHAEKGFTPTCGDIFEISFRTSQTVWGYFSVGSPGQIHQFSDSQFGHIFAFGTNREESRKHLIMGLKGLTIRGEIRTNVEAVGRILENPDFINNKTYTQWLEHSVYFSSPLTKKVSTQYLIAVFAAACYTGMRYFKESEETFIRMLEQGQAPTSISIQYDMTLVHKGMKFRCESHYIGPEHIRIILNGSSVAAKVRNIYPQSMQNGRDSCYLISGGFDGRNRKVFFKKDAEDNLLVTFDGTTYTFLKEHDPRQVRAPVSGKLVRWLIPNGGQGEKGQAYVEIEIMKTYMQLTLSNSGILEHAKPQGASFNIGDILCVLELPSEFIPPILELYPLPFPIFDNVKPPKLALETFCSGGFRNGPRMTALSNFREGKQQLLNALNGFYPAFDDVKDALNMFYHVLDPLMPFIELQEACEVATPLIPKKVRKKIVDVIQGVFSLFEVLSKNSWYSHFDRERDIYSIQTNNGELDTLLDEELCSIGDHDDIEDEGVTSNISSKEIAENKETDNEFTLEENTETTPNKACSNIEEDKEKTENYSTIERLKSPSEFTDYGSFKTKNIKNLNFNACSVSINSCSDVEAHILECLKHINEIIEESIQNSGENQCSIDEFVSIRNQFDPLIHIIRRNEKGRWMRLMYELHEIILYYIEIEKLFEERSSLVTARVIPSLRTEYSLPALLQMGRSHQQLKAKNEIMEEIAKEMANNSSLLQCTFPFRETIHQIAELTSIEYTKIAGAFRYVLLMKDNATMLTQIQSVANKVYEYSQYISFGGQVQGQYLISMANTPSSPLQYPLSTPSLTWNGVSNMGVQSVAISSIMADFTNFPDFALLGCIGHPNTLVGKIAFEIYIRRHYEACGLSFYAVKSKGERWDGSSIETHSLVHQNTMTVINTQDLSGVISSTGDVQKSNNILGVWTHNALTTSSLYQTLLDSLKSNTLNIPLINGGNADKYGLDETVSKNKSFSRLDPISFLNSTSKSSTNSEVLSENSRWRSMLSAFSDQSLSSIADDLLEESLPIQTSIGLYFSSVEDFRMNFGKCIDEIKILHRVFPQPSTSVDSFIMLIILSSFTNLDIVSRSGTNSHIGEREEPKGTGCAEEMEDFNKSHDVSRILGETLNKYQDKLYNNNIHMVSFTVSPYTNEETSESLSATLIYPKTPLHYHFRSTRSIPVVNYHDLNQEEYNLVNVDENDNYSTKYFIEEPYIRNISNTLLSTLELKRLRYFTIKSIPSSISGISLYVGTPRELYSNSNNNRKSQDNKENNSVQKNVGGTTGNSRIIQDNSVQDHMAKFTTGVIGKQRCGNSDGFQSGLLSTQTSIEGITLFKSGQNEVENKVSNTSSKVAEAGTNDSKVKLESNSATRGSRSMNALNINKQRRYFIRVLVQHECCESYFEEQERYFIAALSTLESWLSFDQNYTHSSSGAGGSKGLHHLLFTSVGILSDKNSGFITTSMAEEAAITLVQRYAQRIQQTSLQTMEFRYLQRSVYQKDSNNVVVPIRFVIDNPTGQAIRLRSFVEIKNPTTSGGKVFAAIDSKNSFLNYVSSNNGKNEAFNLPELQKEVKTRVVMETDKSNITRMMECKVPNLMLYQYEHNYDGKPLDIPHPLIGKVDQKRYQAAELNTVYIYDFLDLFEEAIKGLWKKCPKYFVTTPSGVSLSGSNNKSFKGGDMSSGCDSSNIDSNNGKTAFLPGKLMECVELDINRETGELECVNREPGNNTCGMVAWCITMHTPEYPKGRRIVLIGNDITYQMGTFGIQEDLLFQRASEYARSLGIPRIFIAANSGARMGLATEVQRCLKIEFIDPNNPVKGYKYLYVTEDDYIKNNLHNSIHSELIEHPKDGRIYKITDVIGSQMGLGIENLCGSGGIAGETSKAAKSIMTITYVTTRTVGIGAYLARLGHRVIQKAHGAPIILTGYQALNKVASKEIYSSNDELGGIDVMAKNGVTHLVVKDDLEGCVEILKWLSYVPEYLGGRLPIMVDPTDPIYRNITYMCNSNTDDPRLMLTGCVDSRGRCLSGLCDKDSFKEVMSDWAKSVIVGRGRIGGIPVGFILVETRVTEYVQPADPVMPHTSELKVTRPGQIWFPDSAYKTAQAIRDFNVEELPLIVIANWRGFSGGQKDMFDQVLKFGSYVVDELVNYKQPCFIYIPPRGELRGGAWVVVDSNINPEYIEMYADPTARGSVLEATGIVEIKFRNKALKEWMMRLDPELLSLQEKDQHLHSKGYPIDSAERSSIKDKINKRCGLLMPVYHAAAVHFADLHDTANRMKAKNAICDIVQWKNARVFFIHRIKRQLLLFSLRSDISQKLGIPLLDSQNIIFQWALDDGIDPNNNTQFIQWICHSANVIEQRISQLATLG